MRARVSSGIYVQNPLGLRWREQLARDPKGFQAHAHQVAFTFKTLRVCVGVNSWRETQRVFRRTRIKWHLRSKPFGSALA
ncbi:MAG: hypothetical protein B6D41_21690 [Chloroflexi bacterium UTCFX4]|nr:MAG: hypothetical protein B6D41_21690 [Chloroflexi bacterium UTCFX4]